MKFGLKLTIIAFFAASLAIDPASVIHRSVQAAGPYLSTAGPVNQSMGSASTAAPLDAIGATYWNPASIGAVPNELGVGLTVVTPLLETSSSIEGFGGDTSQSEPGASILPTVGWVFRNEDSPLTFGLGMHAVAGVKTNYSSSTTNPIFFPQSNTPGFPGGMGRVYMAMEWFQIAPMLSYAVSDQFSLGAGPTITAANISIDPLVATHPDDADGSGAPRYPSGRGTRVHWGGGFQLGAYFITDTCWHFGASLKSPQWMESFRWKTEDEVGLPRVGQQDIDLPMILSVGTAYSGYYDWVFALDARYYDFKNTDGFGPHGFNADGSLNGLGMSSVLEIGVGAQYKLSERCYLRSGYIFNQNPYQDAEATFAALAPLFYQHQLQFGCTRYLSETLALNLAYGYWPECTVSGPLVTPAGAVPGGSVETQSAVHQAALGLSVRY